MAKGAKHYFIDGTEHKGSMHKMPGGILHSNVKHTKSSKKLYHYGQLSKKGKQRAKGLWGK